MSGVFDLILFLNMSTFDFFLAIPIAYGAFQGYRKGLLLELVSLVALVLAILGGLKLLDSALPVMGGFVGDAHGLLPYVTFLFVFVAIILLIHLGGLLLKKVIDFTSFTSCRKSGVGLPAMLNSVVTTSFSSYTSR